MPSRTPLASGSLHHLTVEPYVCPSCLHSVFTRTTSRVCKPTRVGFNGADRQQSTVPAPGKRHQSTLTVKHDRHDLQKRFYQNGLASRTAVNAPSPVPPPFRELYQRLSDLQEQASSFLDLSRVQLALRSLESNDPTVRVAFLGLGDSGLRAARKLARALLSDALGVEEDWEGHLKSEVGDGRAVLLRYGGSDDVVQRGALVQELPIPSRFLEKYKIEVLIAPFNSNALQSREASASLQETLLVPMLTTLSSTGGRVGFVRYPVHRALLVADGIAAGMQMGQAKASDGGPDMIRTVLSLPLRTTSNPQATSERLGVDESFIDVDLANHAIDLFRSDMANGPIFSDEWQKSRVPSVGEWLVDSIQLSSNGLKNAIHNTIEYAVATASDRLTEVEVGARSAAQLASVPERKRQNLDSELSKWSHLAHRDLQLNLKLAFSSAAWRRTLWWRLLWRIDDVTASASSILHHSYLHEAESSLANVCGRIEEAGLATAKQLKETALSEEVAHSLLPDEIRSQVAEYEAIGDREETAIGLLQVPTLLSRVQQESGLNAIIDPPWPQTINLSRQQMLHTMVPNIHRKAQTYLLSALSTIGGSSALGVWLWVATSGIAMYEAGAIAALGLVWSLRRLQTKWERERATFVGSVMENGRSVLAEVEMQLRKVIRTGGVVKVRHDDVVEWEAARRAIAACQRALTTGQQGELRAKEEEQSSRLP